MMLPEEYQTGNKNLDDKIAKALSKNASPNSKYYLPSLQAPGKPRITVSEKDARTYKDGTLFASAGEMARWDFLLQVQRAREIKGLVRQVPFLLQEEFTNEQWGKIPALTYVADFAYTNISFRKGLEGRKIVEDSKGGFLTDTYKIKKKLFLYKYGHLAFFEV